MPKRATHTYESEKDGISDTALGVYYCMCCGESNLILGPGVVLSSLPRRKTDGAYVLDKEGTVFKLKSKRGETKLIRRPNGFERQYRLDCWNCGVPVAYRSEESEDAKLTYVLPSAMGAQEDLYLMLYQVPPCIQSTGPASVRVAIEVESSQPKKAITAVENAAVGVSVVSEPRDGLANAELTELMGKVRARPASSAPPRPAEAVPRPAALRHASAFPARPGHTARDTHTLPSPPRLAQVLGLPRQQLSLSRGWSAKSKFLLVSSMEAVEVFRKLRAAVDTDVMHATGGGPSKGPGGGGGDDQQGPAATEGAASSGARRQWDERDLEADDLAPAPSRKEQTFRN